MPGNKIVFDEESNYLDAKRDLYPLRGDREVSRGFDCGASRGFEGPHSLRRRTEGSTEEQYHHKALSLLHISALPETHRAGLGSRAGLTIYPQVASSSSPLRIRLTSILLSIIIL